MGHKYEVGDILKYKGTFSTFHIMIEAIIKNDDAGPNSGTPADSYRVLVLEDGQIDYIRTNMVDDANHCFKVA